MTISLRLNDADSALVKKYAELQGVTISELIRQSIMQRIKDEFYLAAYEKAIAEYHENPRQYGKGLTANLSGQWRYRIGDYRLIAEIQDNKVVILILTIGHRLEIYKEN